jgi:uncharacterized protein YegP (UPF0339 family)
VTSFLIEYHRKTGERKMTPFRGPEGRAKALKARLEADFARQDSDIEYVVIESASEADLRRTHRRYFESLHELVESSLPGELNMDAKFELYRGADGKYRFRLRARNGEIVAVSEAYQSKASALAGIESTRRSAVAATVVDQTS